MLEIRDVAKTYGSGSQVTHALRSISFSIAERELVCVVGPSGCGKTTLLKCIAGLRTALALAVITMVLSEYFSSTSGVGYILLISKNTFQLGPMWAAIVLIGLIGYLLNLAYLLAERRMLAWHRGWRAATPQ